MFVYFIIKKILSTVYHVLKYGYSKIKTDSEIEFSLNPHWCCTQLYSPVVKTCEKHLNSFNRWVPKPCCIRRTFLLQGIYEDMTWHPFSRHLYDIRDANYHVARNEKRVEKATREFRRRKHNFDQGDEKRIQEYSKVFSRPWNGRLNT